jgi:hypothetical protein
MNVEAKLETIKTYTLHVAMTEEEILELQLLLRLSSYTETQEVRDKLLRELDELTNNEEELLNKIDELISNR